MNTKGGITQQPEVGVYVSIDQGPASTAEEKHLADPSNTSTTYKWKHWQ